MDSLVSTEDVDFSRREADVAIRLSRPKRVFISRIADLAHDIAAYHYKYGLSASAQMLD